jgi:hypothetical protein
VSYELYYTMISLKKLSKSAAVSPVDNPAPRHAAKAPHIA